jgi:alkenylglycerophosphocholine/alkenylglycerophosphoethanolamine hydrolase
MRPDFILWLAFIVALLDWVGIVKGWRKCGYFTKPGVILALLLWLGLVGGLHGWLIWFAIGLLCSLAGDVFLMLPREQFLAGLLAFLLAHLAYIVGFTPDLPPFNLSSLILAVLVILNASLIANRILASLKNKGNAHLKIPVLIYVVIIDLMLFSAALTLVRPEWAAIPALLTSGGAYLFVLSDTLLGWNKFVAPLHNGRLMVRITYQIGQGLIIIGAAYHYLGQH